ncbi:undecaprenyl-phosphate glucose phosphotransferase [Pseudaeromonas sharmana]|uniref:Undecaprenyl-phosphate glucose phosphotransferase n=1 Tax=Pseudaeromonas sharmana TaxID=328412 RepID=A0ABV8CNH5_9GAMM
MLEITTDNAVLGGEQITEAQPAASGPGRMAHELPSQTMASWLGELEKIAPLTTLFKSFLDPILVVITLYALHFAFDVTFAGMEVLVAVLAFLLTIVFMDGTVLFMPGSLRSWRGLGRFLGGWLFICMALVLTGYVSGLASYFYPPFILSWFVVAPVALLASHAVVRGCLMLATRRKGRRKVAIVGANHAGTALRDRILANSYLNMEFVGFFDDRELNRLEGVSESEMLCGLAEMPAYLAEHGIHKVYISLPMSSQPRVMKLLDELQDSTSSIYFVPDFFIFDLIQAHVDHLAGVPVVCICESPFRGLKAVIKRASDVVFASAILALLWPVMLVTALAVKLTSKGPVFFKQRRYGADGESILVYKFRSMTVMEDGAVVTQAKKNDQRLTPIGGFLRKSSLDELPQLLNVLEGTMSLVGPRPHANAHNEYYRKLIKGYMIRHKVRPGITGWAQVNGCRGETDTLDKMEQRVRYDLDYLRHWSLLMDIRIIFMTAFQVLRREGNAY